MSGARRGFPLWPLALAATLAVRGLVAWSRLDELELERYGITVAQCLLDGMPLDPEQLPIISHLRGSYLFGLALVPLVWLFGSSLLTAKLLAVAWSAATGAVLVATVERALGRAAGWTAMGMFVFAWPAFQMVDVLALGSHADSVLFLVLPLLLLARGADPSGLSIRSTLALGAVVGAGCLFSMQVWVALPALLAVYLLCPQGGRRGWFARHALGLAAALPFLALIRVLTPSALGSVVNKPLEERILADGLGAALERATRLLSTDLRRSWLFEENGGAWLSWCLVAAVLFGFVATTARLRPRTWVGRGRRRAVSWNDRLWVFATVHFVSFTGAYAISDFQLNFLNTLDGMGSRYVLPLFPALCFWTAGGAAWAAQRCARPVAVLLALAPTVAGIGGLTSLIRPWVGGSLPPVQGTELYSFREHVEYAGGDDLAARLAWVERVEPDWPEDRPYAYFEAFLLRKNLNVQLLRGDLARTRTLPEAVRPYVYVELGMRSVPLYVAGIEFNRPDAMAQLASTMAGDADRLPPADRHWFRVGQGRGLAERQLELSAQNLYYGAKQGRLSDPVAIAFDIVRQSPAPARAELCFGMGFHVGLRVVKYGVIHTPLLAGTAEVEPELLDPWMQGFARGYRFRFKQATYRVPGEQQFETDFAPRERAQFRAVLAGL